MLHSVVEGGRNRSWLKRVRRGGGIDRSLPAPFSPLPAITEMLSQQSDYCPWRSGKQEGGGSETGAWKCRVYPAKNCSYFQKQSSSLLVPLPHHSVNQFVKVLKQISKSNDFWNICLEIQSVFIPIFQSWNHNNEDLWRSPALKWWRAVIAVDWAAIWQVTFPLNWPWKKHFTLGVRKALATRQLIPGILIGEHACTWAKMLIISKELLPWIISHIRVVFEKSYHA